MSERKYGEPLTCPDCGEKVPCHYMAYNAHKKVCKGKKEKKAKK